MPLPELPAASFLLITGPDKLFQIFHVLVSLKRVSAFSFNFEMLVLASPARWSGIQMSGVVCLPMPLKVHDLLSTLDMMLQAQQRIRRKLRSRPRERSKEEQDLINEAKALLMDRNNMTESEAHRYIQKMQYGQWDQSSGNGPDDHQSDPRIRECRITYEV